MKSKMILVAFLLVLLISSIFAVSAVEYSVSEQSITSFDETLPDDVLFFLDRDLVTETIVASAGSSTGEHPAGSYVSTQAVGGDIYSNDDYTTPWITAVYLNFTIPIVVASIMTVSLYSIYNYQTTTADTNEIGVWDGDSWEDFGDIDYDHFPPYDETWVNFTIGSEYIIDDIIMLRGYLVNDDNIFIYVDYAEVVVTSPIVLSEDSYAESFADMSDWEISEGNTITTDGDVATFTTEGDDAYNIYYCNTPSQSFENYYLEFRYSVNDTDADKLGISLKSEDSYLGDIIYSLGFFHSTTDYETHKVLVIGTGIVESIAILIKDDDGDAPIAFNFDYLRISPANESGYQDDCSTVAYTTALRVDVESDGDHIQFQYSGGGGTGELSFHTDIGGSNIAAIDTNYYPFIGWDVVNLTDDYYEVYADNTLVYTGTGLGLQYVNVEASGEVEYTTITFVLHTVTESMALDWVKGYSIANWTYDDGGAESTNDYSYVQDGNLIVHTDTYTKWNYDPALSVTIGDSLHPTLWQASLVSGSGYFRFRELLDTNTLWDQGITQGVLVGAELTDLDILIYGNIELSAITFFITPPQWREVSEAELIFNVPLDETGLNMLLIFLGLFMIPASTLYLVKGGRSEASMDKLFFGLIAFVMGWALFLGGIM